MFFEKLFAKKQPGKITEASRPHGESSDLQVTNSKPNGMFKTLGEECMYNSLYGYSKNHGLVDITFSPNIETIKFGEVAECPNLRKVFIPKTVKRIEGYCFSKNPKLKSVVFEDFAQIESIGGHAFDETPWFKSLGDFAMIGDTLLKYQGNDEIIYIPDDVRVISHNAFSGSNLQQVIFSEQSICEYIGGGAFAECNNLTEITFPKSMRNVAYAAFRDCANLRKLVVNDEIETIEFRAFTGCIALDEAYYPSWMDEKNEGVAPFLKYDTFIYKKWTWEQERKRAYEWHIDLLKNKVFREIYELAKNEVVSSGEIGSDAGIDEVFDSIYSHRVLSVLSPESCHSAGTSTYSWWECPKEYFNCAFVGVILLSEERLKKYHSGIVFEIGQDDTLNDEDAQSLRVLSEMFDFPVMVLRKAESGGYIDLLTGYGYYISSTYAGYSHDGSEDYYDNILKRR